MVGPEVMMKSETTRRVIVGGAEETVKVDDEEMQAKAEDRLKEGRLAGGDEEERDDQKGYCWRTGETGEERNGRETRVEDKIEGDRR